MKIIDNITDMKLELNHHKQKPIGFVPTMGFLHEGHLSLVDESVRENELTVMSIFVNPLQFGPNEDFDTYPRDADRDAELAKTHGVDILFMPTTEIMYPKKLTFSLKVTEKADVLCGRSRAGHFDGVVTVLLKLFNIIQPTNVYFGMKDAQQLAIVHAFAEQFNLPINIIGLATVREPSGLAKSSRNVYLSDEEKHLAKSLQISLNYGAELIKAREYNVKNILDNVRAEFYASNNVEFEYLELLSYPELEEVTEIESTVVLAIAVKYNQARLIDNLIIDKNGDILTKFN